jgi:uridine phosphorylase
MQTEMIINPRREKGEPELPTTGLLCINPGDSRFLAELAAEKNSSRHFLFNSNLQVIPAGEKTKGLFIAGPAVGAPMAVMTLEKLIALGAKRIIVCGCCGSLNPELKIGDILLPNGGVSEEGTSKHYPITGQPASSPALLDLLREGLTENNFSCKQGPVWTTDAVYRESRAKIKEYAQKSLLAVDMEYYALATVAIYRKIELAAVFVVSDELWGAEWRPGFSDRAFRKKNRRVLECLLAITTS